MIGRKYVFESKSTRLRRLLLSTLILILFSSALIGSFIAYIPIYAKMQKGRASGVFYQKSPDAIAVFTGDQGRIHYALDLLKKNPSSKLLISGVHAANSFQTLLDAQSDAATGEAVKPFADQIDLDYESKNTFENVRETVEFLKKNPNVGNVLIISSDYHIMRINIIISHFMTSSKPKFYFDSVSTSYSSWKEIRKLLKESLKIARTFFQLKVMRENIVLEDLEN